MFLLKGITPLPKMVGSRCKGGEHFPWMGGEEKMSACMMRQTAPPFRAQVYDITAYLKSHPGGPEQIIDSAGMWCACVHARAATRLLSVDEAGEAEPMCTLQHLVCISGHATSIGHRHARVHAHAHTHTHTHTLTYTLMHAWACYCRRGYDPGV